MSADFPAALQEAHAIVADQLARLRALADSCKRRAELINGTLRQAERQFDELAVQQRTAKEQRRMVPPAVTRRSAEIRARCDALVIEQRSNMYALKQIEQLIRQIDMSSGALTGAEDTNNADPWILALRAQVILGREEERLRLAREVHDGPAQVLANSLMILETCFSLAQNTDDERLITMLDRTRKAVKEGMQDVRRFIADLRPGKLEEHGLAATISEYVRGYSDTYGNRISVESGDLPRLPAEAEIVLYRITQEALQNVHKYAPRASVVIRLGRQNTMVFLSIRDDGPGFDVYEVARRAGQSSWGLTSMRERAELVGARFTVTSRPGYGTEVTVTVPITDTV